MAKLLAKVAVGNEPRFVALSPDDQEAYVTNALDGTVAVVALLGSDAFRVVAQIPVGTEPRGLAITPNGTRLLVANHTAGTVSIIDPIARSVIGTVPVGGNPMAVAITNNGDADDHDERAFVTQFLAELIPGGPDEEFDTGKRGNVQGGCGFASDAFASPGTCTTLGATTPANPNIYDHGITQGASDALDAQTLWVQTVRALLRPPPSDAAALGRGQTIFGTTCASCHGGQKWTKSKITYRDNPAFTQDPAVGGVPLDPGVINAGAQIVSFTLSGVTLKYLEDVGTFVATDPLEIRGAGAASGQLALGGLGFNVPSLSGVGSHAPYLHNGEAQSLSAVFPLHTLGTGTIATMLTAQQQADLIVFLNSIDGRTITFRSQGDDFRDALALP